MKYLAYNRPLAIQGFHRQLAKCAENQKRVFDEHIIGLEGSVRTSVL